MTFRRSSVYRDLADTIDRRAEHIRKLEADLKLKDQRIVELEREVARLLEAEVAG